MFCSCRFPNGNYMCRVCRLEIRQPRGIERDFADPIPPRHIVDHHDRSNFYSQDSRMDEFDRRRECDERRFRRDEAHSRRERSYSRSRSRSRSRHRRKAEARRFQQVEERHRPPPPPPPPLHRVSIRPSPPPPLRLASAATYSPFSLARRNPSRSAYGAFSCHPFQHRPPYSFRPVLVQPDPQPASRFTRAVPPPPLERDPVAASFSLPSSMRSYSCKRPPRQVRWTSVAFYKKYPKLKRLSVGVLPPELHIPEAYRVKNESKGKRRCQNVKLDEGSSKFSGSPLRLIDPLCDEILHVLQAESIFPDWSQEYTRSRNQQETENRRCVSVSSEECEEYTYSFISFRHNYRLLLGSVCPELRYRKSECEMLFWIDHVRESVSEDDGQPKYEVVVRIENICLQDTETVLQLPRDVGVVAGHGFEHLVTEEDEEFSVPKYDEIRHLSEMHIPGSNWRGFVSAEVDARTDSRGLHLSEIKARFTTSLKFVDPRTFDLPPESCDIAIQNVYLRPYLWKVYLQCWFGRCDKLVVGFHEAGHLKHVQTYGVEDCLSPLGGTAVMDSCLEVFDEVMEWLGKTMCKLCHVRGTKFDVNVCYRLTLNKRTNCFEMRCIGRKDMDQLRRNNMGFLRNKNCALEPSVASGFGVGTNDWEVSRP